jgi:glyoxylase-like metal-dependent hydrolase (beta-lactamase superfamily II)
MSSEEYNLLVLKPGNLKRDRFGNILDARSNVTLVQSDNLNLIVDTGLSSEKECIINSLRSQCLKPNNIDFVINTHNHIDHTGNNGLFSKAQIVIHSNEIGFSDKSAKLCLIDKDTELVQGIKIIETFGHTKGSISVLLTGCLEEHKGRFAITGDALPIMDNYLKWVPPGINISPGLALGSMEKIIHMSDFIVPGHDKPFKVIDRVERISNYLY